MVRGRLHDEVDTPAKLSAWFERWGPAAVLTPWGRGPRESSSCEVSRADLAQFRRLRDALRSLIGLAAQSACPDPDRIGVLNEVAARAPAWPAIHGGDGRLELVEHTRARGAEAALAVIARDAMLLLSGAEAQRLRACASPDCVQYFLASDARQRWCSPGCGNRARVARHYDRHRRANAAS